jgi:hypothetical protein
LHRKAAGKEEWLASADGKPLKARETEAYRVIENLISRLFLAPRSGFLDEFVSVTVKVYGSRETL